MGPESFIDIKRRTGHRSGHMPSCRRLAQRLWTPALSVICRQWEGEDDEDRRRRRYKTQGKTNSRATVQGQ